MSNFSPSTLTIEGLETLSRKIKEGYRLSREEAFELIQMPCDSNNSNASEDSNDSIENHIVFQTFLTMADDLRRHFLGNAIELCSIINAKSGKCTEDCKFCAQSAHYSTDVETYDLIAYPPILSMAKENQLAGVHRFSLVMSGRGIEEADLLQTLDYYDQLSNDCNLSLCASLGIIDETALSRLKNAGVQMYHHNLEAGSQFYKTLCTTHTFEERIETLIAAKKAGLKLCSGGIIGMGESWEDRMDLIFTLRDLEVVSVPVNILNPILGTPFEKVPKLSQGEILKTIALFRWIHPTADIRLGGGRHLLDAAGRLAFSSGASATITGNYLTTTGQDLKGDLSMFEALKLPLELRKI